MCDKTLLCRVPGHRSILLPSSEFSKAHYNMQKHCSWVLPSDTKSKHLRGPHLKTMGERSQKNTIFKFPVEDVLTYFHLENQQENDQGCS